VRYERPASRAVRCSGVSRVALVNARARGTEPALRRLAGARIVRIGAPAERSFEGGGLVVDYILPGSTAEHRLIFEFNELGMWIVWDSFENAESIVVKDYALTQSEVMTLASDQR
jgi:hypothetical protein